ncbi:hypothetical protein NPIL_680191 [Nephila pilipes]|uniref:Uncharacterized protein n=1 Tax=Nephila pilipes TaxID=299642 RepID=A0A8X6MV25_NEPPI|nr:hypothetical protein NPIL_680191 [Nephila pilipes]
MHLPAGKETQFPIMLNLELNLSRSWRIETADFFISSSTSSVPTCAPFQHNSRQMDVLVCAILAMKTNGELNTICFVLPGHNRDPYTAHMIELLTISHELVEDLPTAAHPRPSTQGRSAPRVPVPTNKRRRSPKASPAMENQRIVMQPYYDPKKPVLVKMIAPLSGFVSNFSTYRPASSCNLFRREDERNAGIVGKGR